MTVLIIDTTTERGLIALGDMQGNVVKEKRLPPGYQNSDHLFPVLIEMKVVPKDLELIVCAAGPGSYTGIRVGAVVAKTLSFLNNISLVGVCTLRGFPEPSLIDAKAGGAYIRNGDSWVRLPLTEALEQVGTGPVFTPNASQLHVKAPNVQWKECYPSAEQLLKVGLESIEEASQKGDLVIQYQ
jgi:tRNA threonylcarbamoyl adenosine modification protein YeaZ